MTKTQVLVVDDSALMRRVISDIINAQRDMQVIETARNGEEALNKIQQVRPDVVTLDIEMPVMDGITALRKIMEKDPIPVIMLSSLTQKGAELTMKALQLGAIDFIPKPSGSISLDIATVSEDIIRKVRVAALVRSKLKRPVLDQSHPFEEVRWQKGSAARPRTVPIQLEKLVLIGTSTGGPKALYQVIPQLPGDLGAGVLIVQHMPPGFTRSLAERLNEMSALTVKEAEREEQVLPGKVYIAPGDFHLKVTRKTEGGYNRLFIDLTSDSPVSGHRPSVDYMFESVASQFWGQIVGVIMTGMGQDGAKGVIEIKKKGGKVIAEDASTCIVFGMPKMAIETGSVDKVVTLPYIAREIQQMF